MGKNLGELNPSDVYPLSNLPDSAVPWGRAIEDDVVGLKRAYEAQQAFIDALRRDIAALAANNTAATQTPMSYTESDSDQLIYYTESGWLYTNTSVVVPTGATQARIAAKGWCRATNDINDPSAIDLDLGVRVFYAHVEDWAGYAPSSIVFVAGSTTAVPVGGTATGVVSGDATIPVTPGWLLVVGLASRVETYSLPPQAMNADTFVSGNINFSFS